MSQIRSIVSLFFSVLNAMLWGNICFRFIMSGMLLLLAFSLFMAAQDVAA